MMVILVSILFVAPVEARDRYTAIYDPSGKALQQFRRSLRRTAKGVGQTRVLQFGASHTAADLFTGYLRQLFQHQYGDAGHGYVMPARPWKGYRHLDVRMDSSSGWFSDRAYKKGGRKDGLYGLAGFSCASSSREDYAWVGTSRKSAFGRNVGRFEIFFLRQPGGGRFQLLVDGVAHQKVDTRSKTFGAGFSTVRLPDGPHDLEIRPLGNGEVRLFGVVMERGAPGVIVDTLGIRGARASVFLKWNEDIWRAQIRRRSPDLILLAYGTNESGDSHDPLKRYERRLAKVLARLKSAAPRASCVLVGPTDRPKKVGRRYVHRERIDDVIAVQKAVATRFGCGFWDAFRAMGGPLSIVRWARADPPLARKDYVHLTSRGYYALADDLGAALLQGADSR